MLTYAQGNKYFTVSGSFAYGKQNETGVETVKDRKKPQLKVQLRGIKSRNYIRSIFLIFCTTPLKVNEMRISVIVDEVVTIKYKELSTSVSRTNDGRARLNVMNNTILYIVIYSSRTDIYIYIYQNLMIHNRISTLIRLQL